MTLFESLKEMPKVDMHIDFLGSIPIETIQKLTKEETTREEVEEIVDFDSLKDYDNVKKLTRTLLNSFNNIEIALVDLINKLKSDNLLYGELFINLNNFLGNIGKENIIEKLIEVINRENINLNIVLEIDSDLSKEDMYNTLNILYKYYNNGISGVFFKKNKLDNFETYKALFDKFIKDDVKYTIVLDSKITSQDKDIFSSAYRIIYNDNNKPDDVFLDMVKVNNILLEFPITYQNYFNIYDSLENHFVYDLFKDNVLLTFTTIDMTSLDTDLLNEYCKLFNVFPFNLHDIVVITLNVLNVINVNDELKNKLIDEFKEKANELL